MDNGPCPALFVGGQDRIIAPWNREKGVIAEHIGRIRLNIRAVFDRIVISGKKPDQRSGAV